MDSFDEKLQKIIAEFGWQATYVPDAEPHFQYTIGLSDTFKHPDLIVFGLTRELQYAILSTVVKQIKIGKRFDEPGIHSFPDDLTVPVAIRKVHGSQHQFYLGYAMGYYREIGLSGQLKALQIFWPDRTGMFPFEPNCDLHVYDSQPRLDLSKPQSEIDEFDSQFD